MVPYLFEKMAFEKNRFSEQLKHVHEKRVTSRIFGIRDFPYLKLGIRDLKAKSGRDSGLKVYVRGGMPKITLRITGLHEVLGRDYGIEEPYWGPSV